MDKKQLRGQIRLIRDTMSEEDRVLYSSIIMDKVVSQNEYREANVIMCFASFGSEINTFSLLKKIIEDNKILVLPKVIFKEQEKYLELFKINNIDKQLTEGVYGIMEPDVSKCEKTEASFVQLFICPGLAFDLQGNRLGYGAGFYDRLFAATDLSRPRIGISFDAQIVEALETDNFDIPMNKIITEKREITGSLEKEVKA